MKTKKIIISFFSIILLLCILTPVKKVGAENPWYIDMKSTRDKSGYETITAKKSVYGNTRDTIAVFEGLKSNTKVLSVTSSNKRVKGNLFYYTENGEEKYSILTKCSDTRRGKETAVITVKCYSNKKEKNYTRKLYVSLSEGYKYGINNMTTVHEGETISIERTSSINKQHFYQADDPNYGFLRHLGEADKEVCKVSSDKEKRRIVIQGNKKGGAMIEASITYNNGEKIFHKFQFNVLDSKQCIQSEDYNLVLGEAIVCSSGVIDNKAKITVTNSDNSVLKHHLQIQTNKEIAKAFHKKLEKSDDPNEREALLYLEGLKEGNSTINVSYKSKENGKEVVHNYQYNITVLNKEKKEKIQYITFVNYENDFIYQEGGLFRDTSGNVEQTFDKNKATWDMEKVLYSSAVYDNATCEFYMYEPCETEVNVKIKDLYNRVITSYTKTLKGKSREDKESKEIVFQSEEIAKEFFCEDKGSWESERCDTYEFRSSYVHVFNNASGNPVSFGEKDIEFVGNTLYSIDIIKKMITLKNESDTYSFSYRIIDKDNVIFMIGKKWTLFKKLESTTANDLLVWEEM